MTGVETGRTHIRSASWHAQHARRGGRLPKGGGSGLTKGSKNGENRGRAARSETTALSVGRASPSGWS